MNKELIKKELIKSIGSEFEPQVNEIVDRIDVMLFDGDQRGKVIKLGDTFWRAGEKLVVRREEDSACGGCHFDGEDCLGLPSCRGFIFKRVEI